MSYERRCAATESPYGPAPMMATVTYATPPDVQQSATPPMFRRSNGERSFAASPRTGPAQHIAPPGRMHDHADPGTDLRPITRWRPSAPQMCPARRHTRPEQALHLRPTMRGDPLRRAAYAIRDGYPNG